MLNFGSWLEITTVSKCIINCSFCPQHVFQAHYPGCETLSFDDFKAVLSKVPKHVAVHFSGFAEPFLNPQCLQMIEYAHDEGFKVVLFSTLFGLNSADVERLMCCDVELVLHLPDNLGNTKIPITDMYRKTLVTAIKKLRISTLYVMDDNFLSNERAGLCKNAPNRNTRGWFFCEKLLVPQFVMLPNCDVVLFCMDFGLSHRLGNLKRESLWDLIESEAYKKVRADRFQMSGCTICRRCVWVSPRFRCVYYVKRLAQRYQANRFLQRYFSK
jgi:MoaA/NifB/PqqE/SkfB family radical SAM enzyme